jgi:electron transport complex protein RnfB
MEKKQDISRRKFLKEGAWGLCIGGIGVAAGIIAAKGRRGDFVWQIDPFKCISCGNCATYCVLEESAVKCVHKYAMCGYCKLCTGFYESEPKALDKAAENQLCPNGAIGRKFVEHPYYEYSIDETLCNGCGKCVKGCTAFGNGSLFLQVRHERCLNCNECSIAAACPSRAFKRVPVESPYLLKGDEKA